MRQLILKISKGHKDEVLEIVEEFEGKNSIFLPNEENDVFIIYLPNRKVNNFLKRIDEFEEPEISLIPRGVITLYPPASESPDQVADVQPKSSLEIYLGGIQSVGSVKGLIGYSFAAGLLVWIGLYTTTVYLLVAAMLVAPFAGPAMNAALATAAGKKPLLKSSLQRYGIAIGTGVIASLLMTLIFPLNTLTPLMVEISHVSKVAIFLPLISGFAGAINIIQSERDSLVSGAAVGILVAASLAPPVGLIGAGIYLLDWEVVSSSVFRIILQLLGIHLSATLVFYFFGKITPSGVRFLKGNKMLTYITSGIVALAIGGMMFWQYSQPPFLRKASMNTELTEELDKKLNKLDFIEVINKDVSFTNTKINGNPTVSYTISVLPRDTTISEAVLKKRIIEYLKENLQYQDDNIYEVYQVNVAED
ncbi:DUF389 domain-containing protein [Salinimicrobium tongyeongense]|jgi:uncharacterized membrane protein|uniref:DUF389 domain-containing protein n=1 Tax=Salinimicrobium tongyeongense TaxID=2809707 RepID=A0ABY6NMB1_9FLAO|nr:DUF389 domain-containing protein [Salinimicrobium tongyeongense]UZH54030.1 DUF389 domain-containing protein [Salinimicrobium tongyeongense]